MKGYSRILVCLVVAVAACAGGDAATTTTSSPPGTTIVPATPAPSVTAPPVTDPPSLADGFHDVITLGAPIRLTSTHRVANVASDDVLNARRLPGAGGPLAAELDPAYSTFRFTGETATADDGGTWMKIVLSDPAVQLVFGPEPYELPWGWVNAHYTEPIGEISPVGGSCDVTGVPAPHIGDPSSAYDQVIDLLLLEFDGCSQLLITLAQADGVDHLGVTLPDVATSAIPGGLRLEILPPDSGWLQVLWPATELFTTGVEVFVARGPGGAVRIDLLGIDVAETAYLADQGQIVVSFEAAGGPFPTRDASVAANAPSVDAGVWTISGYARPFEANLSVSVRDANDTVLDVPVSGDGVNVFGPGAFSVMTTDWSETWGWFEFQVDTSGLPSGNYVVRLADDTAMEDAPTVDVPISVP